ncbi:flagellar hook-associated protein FlgK [Acidovorax sp.]|uniref:flagellar hook-associated protein FlgK n=1 Tax=Acidovorax sp. TaxID=1872122 RepID=UPI002ACE944E|nr:flagellar hook-associated protein FlgK [Acidovorax sp.]MDZ7861802.1 flagellar hook-associated protein FlgK [Acidovorax sp.]
MSLLNVGARALLANQVALQTAGNNIANVNTPGYSRQTVVLQTVQGQFTGGGYIGQGVDVQTILRNQSELLTRQSATAGSVQAGDIVRAERLRQLQDVFSGGATGLGAAINDMMNAFSDVVSAPTDITARTLALTRMDETASRMRSAAERVDEIEYTVKEQLQSSITAINSLAGQIAAVNEQIARAKGNGQTPNDLLDNRDQLIREMNQYVQTTQIPADDGTVGLFVGGSQPLVLGTTPSQVSVDDATQFPGSGQLKLFFNRPGSPAIEVDENTLGGGSVSGLLRFNNTDLSESRNLLGRMAMAIGMTMNEQHKLGLTLDGQVGKDLFSIPTSMPGLTNGAGVGTVTFSDPTKFAASDYEIRFTTGTAGQVVRLSDGKATPFTDAANLATLDIDGLTFNLTTPGVPGDRMLFQPFNTAGANINALVYSPRDLAAANPINAAMGTTNGGTLQLSGLKATDTLVAPPIPGGVTLTFTAGPPTTYAVTGSTTPPSGTAGLAYTSGSTITIDGWEIKLQGTPKTGDTVRVGNALDPQYGDTYTRNAGNATALMNLRDVKMFDESTLADGYAGLMAQVGTRTQSATFAAELSTTIAGNLERDRTAVSGVNLDEEAAKLIQYQQAYQASAKMLQIAQSVFDTLIQGLTR